MAQNKDINKFRMDFTKIFHSKVVPLLQNLDKERVETKRTAITVSIIVYILVFIFCFFAVGASTASEDLMITLMFTLIVGFLPALCVYKYFKKNFERGLKLAVMPFLMQAFGNFRWMPDFVVFDEEIKMSKLYTSFDESKTDDNFIGSYKNVPIRISEKELFYITRDSKGRRHKHVEFKGVFISIEIPKNFTGHTIVREKGLINLGPYKEVKLEDPEFSKMFYVSSTDQIEARYLLTTAFMQRYKNIQKAFSARTISCSFLANKLLLAIPSNRDLFSLGDLNKPVGDTRQFTVFLNEIISIFELIEELKVYQNTGL